MLNPAPLKELNLQVTPVFLKIRNAILEVDPDNLDPETGLPQRRYRYIILTGSSRSSKTFSAIDNLDLYARTNFNKRITAWRDTKADCKKTVLNDATLHFKKTNRYRRSRFNMTESIFTYSTGSTFEIHGTDDENTVHGLNQAVAWLNEPYKISKGIKDQIDQRTTDFMIFDWNPKQAHWLDDLSKDKRAIIIHSTFEDNPFCPPEQREKILSYQTVKQSEVVLLKILTEKQANLYDFTKNPANLTPYQIKQLSRCIENERKKSADMYNWSVYGLGEKAEKPNRIFRWDEVPLQIYLSLDVPEYYYSDWGAVDPWAVGAVKYYDGALYVREKNYQSENDIRIGLTPQERQLLTKDDEGLVQWYFSRLGIDRNRPVVCDPNRILKIRALRAAGFEYAIAAQKPQGSIIDGIDLLNNMPVFYTSDSPNIKYEQENYSRKVDRYGIVLEEAEDLDNHHMDGIRYVGAFLQSQGIIKKL